MPSRQIRSPRGMRGRGRGGLWTNDVVLALAWGSSLEEHTRFVGSLRGTGYPGSIALWIEPRAPAPVRAYLGAHNVTAIEVPLGPCSPPAGKRFTTKKLSGSVRGMCPTKYPQYKMVWARYALYRDFLLACPPRCT